MFHVYHMRYGFAIFGIQRGALCFYRLFIFGTLDIEP